MPAEAPTSLTTPEHRRQAVAAALREARREAAREAAAAAAVRADLDELLAAVGRLSARVLSLEDEVARLRSQAAPAVPPLVVSRGESPAFDVLLGPARDSA